MRGLKSLDFNLRYGIEAQAFPVALLSLVQVQCSKMGERLD